MRESVLKRKLSLPFRSVKAKLITAFLLAGGALILFWQGSRMISGATLRSMSELTRPNEKLVMVHTLFQQFTRIDQLQRRIAQEDKSGRRKRIGMLSDSLDNFVIALKDLYKQEEWQLQKLDTIQHLMAERNVLFWNFIHHRDQLINSNLLVRQIQEISSLIEAYEPILDSTVFTRTHRHVSTTITPPDTVIQVVTLDRRSNLFDWLFGRKRSDQMELVEPLLQGAPEIVIEETVDSIVENLAIIRHDTILPMLERQLGEIIHFYQEQATRMARAETEFQIASNDLTSEILLILQDIEEEELHHIESNQHALAALINKRIGMYSWLLIVILVVLTVLVFLILIDFSRSRQYRMNLEEAKEKAERLGQIKERFLANMSHEIRTPLHAIIGFAEQLKKVQDPPGFELQAIHQSSRHLLQIVNEILEYNRLVFNQLRLECTPFYLREVLEEVCFSMGAAASKRGLAFNINLEVPVDTMVMGDAFRLRQILFNLLGNAIKFTNIGCVRLCATLTEKNADEYLFRLVVEDTGEGIPKESQGHIFKEFEQLQRSKRQHLNGTGLGLSIVKSLVELQSGCIEVESSPGIGSSFSVSLPYAKYSGIAEENGILNYKIPTLPVSYSGTVYIVDDDPYTLQLCERILKSHGYSTCVFQDASVLLKDRVFKTGDVVLTDIHLPQITGYDLLENLRDMKAPVAVIAMTAQALPNEQKTMLHAGFDHLLIKPFTEKDLLEGIGLFTSPAQAPVQSTQDFPVRLDIVQDGLMELLVCESEKDLDVLRAALDSSNSNEVADSLHRLAGRCGQFGFEAWYKKLRKLEVQVRAHDSLDQHREEIECIIMDISISLAAL
jgi:signal transduction histidine kinase/CheY-like chemotaxis protein